MFEAIAVVAAIQSAGVEPCAKPVTQDRMRILERITYGPMCFPENLTDEELIAIVEEYDLRPPAMLGGDDRWFTDILVWTGDVGIGASALATGASLTYSFPADGVSWGHAALAPPGANVLNARFTTLFGAGNGDRGRELLRQAFASWQFYTGLEYREVADDNTVTSQSTVRSADRGDIRVGGSNYGTGSFLAYNAFPSAAGLAGIGGGDMVINTSFFIAGAYNDATNNFRYFRNTVAHEHGHGTGNIHTTPCNSSKLMEPFIHTITDMLTIDEIRGGSRSYGDRFSGNHSALTAHDLGNLISPQNRSVSEPFLSLNGAAGAGGTNQDWFKFNMTVGTTITVTVTPIGGSYQNGQQTSSCNPAAPPVVNASEAGNLGVELRDSTGAVILFSANVNGAGLAETIAAGVQPSGTYMVRVFDAGPNPAANQIVQLYDMTIRIGGVPYPPYAIAGVDKRVQANTNCYFMGDISSRPLEPGATLNVNSYDWDLDGNGSRETANVFQPVTQYVSNGVYPVTLRVTDSNGLWDQDTIDVTVFGATTLLSSVTPSMGNQGATVPVTFTGTNLKNVVNASEFFVLGGGVTVIGTPVPNALGTQVTGLSLQIDAGAAPGARTVSVNNSDGFDNLPGGFTVVAALPGAFDLLSPADDATDVATDPTLSWDSASGATSYTVEVDDEASFSMPLAYSEVTAALSSSLPPATLAEGTEYFWRVTAGNGSGNTLSSGAPWSFTTVAACCVGNANGDNVVDFNDIVEILGNWQESGTPSTPNNDGDANCDGEVDFNDVVDSLGNWLNPCP